ncbi:hypothetical protein [Lactobacillus rhamnosus DSM 14870] [Lacticaseibacillus rhamnosus]|nr:hypothetical protein [Lactobacillus rhamnosus DSM 14870] [Lacticaseibacillus rhamnosus]
MQHYYTNDPDLAHDERTFDFELGGHRLRFTTDNGVFSKHTVDFGSRVLIATVLAETLPDGPILDVGAGYGPIGLALAKHCLLYTSDAADEGLGVDLGGRRIIKKKNI